MFAALYLLLEGSLQAQDFPWRPLLPRERKDTVSLFIVGDIMSHGAQTRSAFRGGSADYSTFFRHLSSRIKGADIAIGNLEFPLAGKPYTGYPSFSGPDEYAKYLDTLGFDVLLTGNNHILDRGSEGLARTLDRLDALPIFHTGSARADTLRKPLILKKKGVTLSLLSFTYGTNQGPTRKNPVVYHIQPEEMQPLLDGSRGADFVLAFPHWGVEYRSVHSAVEQGESARWLAAAGVDFIAGSHPHVVQDYETVDGVPVFYSLGNAVSNQNDLPARLELGLTLRIVKPFGREPYLLDVLPEYLWCTKPGMLEDSYATIAVRDFLGRREAWRIPSDYDNMVRTYEAVQAATGLKDGIRIPCPRIPYDN